jgi:hypothetical protein
MVKNTVISLMVLAFVAMVVHLVVTQLYFFPRTENLNTALHQSMGIIDSLSRGFSDRKSIIDAAKKGASNPENVQEDKSKNGVTVDCLQMIFSEDGNLMKVYPIIQYDPDWLDDLPMPPFTTRRGDNK